MRIAGLEVMLFALLTAGCASEPKRVAAAPSPDELPNLPTREDSYVQASIGADRDRDQPRHVLVPEFKEPPLTQEEKEATDQLDPPYKPLLFAYKRRVPGYAVGVESGIATAVEPAADNIGTERATHNIHAGNIGGPLVGVDRFISRILGHYPKSRSAYSGPAEYPDVGIGDRRDPAKAMRRRGE